MCIHHNYGISLMFIAFRKKNNSDALYTVEVVYIATVVNPWDTEVFIYVAAATIFPENLTT